MKISTAPTLSHLLLTRAEEAPERPAYVHTTDGIRDDASLTRGALLTRALAVAAHLESTSEPGDRVLLVYPSGLAFVEAFFGCLLAGRIAVPLPIPTRRRDLERLTRIAVVTEARLVLTVHDHVAMASGDDPSASLLGVLPWVATDRLDGASAAFATPRTASPDTVAFLQFTSGSTGDPKGTIVTHGNLIANEGMIAQVFGHVAGGTVAGWLPHFHDMGLIGNVLQPLYLGGVSVLLPPRSFVKDPSCWFRAIARHRAHTAGGPDFGYDLCVRKIRPEQLEGVDLAPWKVAFTGAEPIRADTLERFAAKFRSHGFERRAFLPCYGLAEATLVVSGVAADAEPRAHSFDGPHARRRTLVSVGRAALGTLVRIVDPETRASCVDGREGEIWVQGAHVAAGYWARPDATTETFGAVIADEPASGTFLRTGDLGIVVDGELYISGRLKDLVILRGQNLYPQDVERSVERGHAAVRPSGVAAFAVERDGRERLGIVAEVERGPEVRASSRAIIDAIREAVADEHGAAAEVVVLIRAGTLMRTTSGKIQRSANRQALLAGGLDVVASAGWPDAGASHIPLERP